MHGSTAPVLLLQHQHVLFGNPVVLVVWVDAWCPVIGTKCHDGWSGCERNLLCCSLLGSIVPREKQSHSPLHLSHFPSPPLLWLLHG